MLFLRHRYMRTESHGAGSPCREDSYHSSARCIFAFSKLDPASHPHHPTWYAAVWLQTAEDEVQRLQGTLMAMDQVKRARRSLVAEPTQSTLSTFG